MDTKKNEMSNASPVPEKEPSRRILEAALKEFSRYGVEGARVDRIAQKAGVNKAMIYYYFSSKENLYSEVLKVSFGKIIASLKTKTAEFSDLENVLETIQDGWRLVFLRQPDVSKLLLRELANPESNVIPVLASIISRSEIPQIIRHQFEQGIEDKTLRPIDIRQAWVSFVTMNIGYFLLSPLLDRVLEITDSEQFAQERRPAIMDLFLNGVKAR
ncbi:MAG: TetR/AcrR family transcriptional regulator [candidate division Zixibacteria bacterium]|nr:TetR/AcrR family transcriptional regulator [candidate division Zixibacteria bacterium]